MTNTAAPQSPLDHSATKPELDPREARRLARRGSAGMRHGFWLVVAGLAVAASAIDLPDRAWGVVMMLPLAWAIGVAITRWREAGEVCSRSLWLIFGTSFPFVAGLSLLTGVTVASTWIVALGLLLIGLLQLSGVVRRS